MAGTTLTNSSPALVCSKKCPCCRSIGQQKSKCGPTVSCSEFRSDALQIRRVSVTTISLPFLNSVIPNHSIYQRFTQTSNDGTTNRATWVLANMVNPSFIYSLHYLFPTFYTNLLRNIMIPNYIYLPHS